MCAHIREVALETGLALPNMFPAWHDADPSHICMGVPFFTCQDLFLLIFLWATCVWVCARVDSRKSAFGPWHSCVALRAALQGRSLPFFNSRSLARQCAVAIAMSVVIFVLFVAVLLSTPVEADQTVMVIDCGSTGTRM